MRTVVGFFCWELRDSYSVLMVYGEPDIESFDTQLGRRVTCLVCVTSYSQGEGGEAWRKVNIRVSQTSQTELTNERTNQISEKGNELSRTSSRVLRNENLSCPIFL